MQPGTIIKTTLRTRFWEMVAAIWRLSIVFQPLLRCIKTSYSCPKTSQDIYSLIYIYITRLSSCYCLEDPFVVVSQL